MPHDSAPRGFDRELGPGGLETRTIGMDRSEVRAAGDADTERMLIGYGSVFGVDYRVSGYFDEWDEVVEPGAFTDAIADGADVRSMRNHDTNHLLGRTTSGSLRLSEDDTGLRYEVDINPDDPSAVATWAQVQRGDIDGSSIWFRIERQEWTHPTEANGLEVSRRRILQVTPLFEAGPVVFPASPTANVGARSGQLVDAVLRSAGVDSDRERADLAQRLLADPASAEGELRDLFARAPDLRAAVCACETETSDDEGQRLAVPEHVVDAHRRHRVASGLAARYGLPNPPKE